MTNGVTTSMRERDLRLVLKTSEAEYRVTFGASRHISSHSECPIWKIPKSHISGSDSRAIRVASDSRDSTSYNNVLEGDQASLKASPSKSRPSFIATYYTGPNKYIFGGYHACAFSKNTSKIISLS